MVTLHLLQYLSDNGFGTIDESLFFEKLPIQVKGVAIFSRGGESTIGIRTCSQRFDLYSRGTSDLLGYDALEKIKTFLTDELICELPTIDEVSNRVYKNVRVTRLDNIENIGTDENDRVVYRLGAEITYIKE